MVYLISLLIGGITADRLGISKIMKMSAFLTVFLSYPIFLFLTTNLLGSIIIAVTTLGILAGLFLGPMHAYMLQLFPPEVRCRGVSIGFSLGVAILGGTTPLISEYLTHILSFAQAPFLYFSLSAFVMFILLSKNPIIINEQRTRVMIAM